MILGGKKDFSFFYHQNISLPKGELRQDVADSITPFYNVSPEKYSSSYFRNQYIEYIVYFYTRIYILLFKNISFG